MKHGFDFLPICNFRELLNQETDDGEIIEYDNFRLIGNVFFIRYDNDHYWKIYLRHRRIGHLEIRPDGNYAFHKIYTSIYSNIIFNYDFVESVESAWKHIAQNYE